VIGWLTKIAAVEDFLAPLGVAPDVVQWVSYIDDSQIMGLYTNELRKNPNLTIEQLQSLNVEPSQGAESTSRELERMETYKPSVEFWRWGLVQFRKSRKGPPQQFSWGLDYDYMDAPVVMDNTMSAIFDWYRATTPEIASYSWEQAVAATNDWHRAKAEEGAGREYDGTQETLYSANGWSVVTVTSENDLKVEGHKMNHCVGSYCDDNVNLGSKILSLRGPDNEPHATIEVEANGGVKQIQGHSNSVPKDQYKDFLRNFWHSPGAMSWLSQLGNTADEAPDVQWHSDRYNDTYETLENIMEARDDPARIAEMVEFIGDGEDEYGLPLNVRDIEVADLYDGIVYSLMHDRVAGYYPNVHGRIASRIAQLAWKSDTQLIRDDPFIPTADWQEYSQIRSLLKVVRQWESRTMSMYDSILEELGDSPGESMSPEEQYNHKRLFEHETRLQLPVALGDEVEKELFELKQKLGPITSKDGRVLY